MANKFQTGFDQPLLCGMYVDKRLAGIQAVQTLSRLNRAYPGKDTTYVLDFVNDAEEVLAAFKTYYATAELADVTDPNLVFNLRAKLDAAGHYDDFEVDRVVEVELNPNAKQSDLVAALEPVVDRLLKRYKAAQEASEGCDRSRTTTRPPKTAKDELDALMLFKRDMGAFLRALHVPLADLRLRQHGHREALHLLQATAAAAGVRPRARRDRPLEGGADAPQPEESGQARHAAWRRREPEAAHRSPRPAAARCRRRRRRCLDEIIEKVNDLFEGELTDQDKLVYVNNVIKGKLLESEDAGAAGGQQHQGAVRELARPANRTHERDHGRARRSHAMSTQALESEKVRKGLKDVLLGPAQLYEALRAKGDLATSAEQT